MAVLVFLVVLGLVEVIRALPVAVHGLLIVGGFSCSTGPKGAWTSVVGAPGLSSCSP